MLRTTTSNETAPDSSLSEFSLPGFRPLSPNRAQLTGTVTEFIGASPVGSGGVVRFQVEQTADLPGFENHLKGMVGRELKVHFAKPQYGLLLNDRIVINVGESNDADEAAFGFPIAFGDAKIIIMNGKSNLAA